MSNPAKEDALYKEFMAVPSNMIAEILNGKLITQPRPAPRHSRAAAVLGSKVGAPFDFNDDGPGGWAFFTEPELHLDSDILVPDLAAWRRERMTTLPDTAYFTTAPDWICEVLSPSTIMYDKLEKRDIYGQHNVQYLWFVDPIAQTLEAFELIDKRWTLLKTFGHDVEVAIAPFEAVPFALKSLWFE